jgi:hypothetical protein
MAGPRAASKTAPSTQAPETRSPTVRASDHDRMSLDLTTFASSTGVTVVGAWTVYHFTKRQALAAEQRTRALAAAADLAQALRELQMLMRKQGRVEVDQREVADAFSRWGQALDRQQHRLPDDWRHLRRSVLAAAGTVFGGIAFTHLRPDAADPPLEEPDFLWQDFGDDYIDYVLDERPRWGIHRTVGNCSTLIVGS